MVSWKAAKNIRARTDMDFHKIWIEQCEAAREWLLGETG